MNENKEWFESWFDSPYYHLLYKDRDWKEAEFFITNLNRYLELDQVHHVLDLACGKGRHSITLSNFGIRVTGIDLSPHSIKEAKKNESESLKFAVHDMREVYKEYEFSHVFNLFTSFGYFSNTKDNERVLVAIYKSLKPNGTFVLDFLNIEKIISDLPSNEEKEIDGINFQISKKYEDHFISKKICFSIHQNDFSFQERVTAFTQDELIKLTSNCGFEIKDTFGGYDLSKFIQNQSERLILILTKKGA